MYALLVGINAYPPPVTPLHGCVNDVNAISHYLETHQAEDGYEPRFLLLTDQAATRQAVINGFRQHLSHAGPGDVVLFFYAGHGSQEMAAPEFWPMEPDHRNETLVLYDSRLPGAWDLADKELAFLISEVAKDGVHVVVVLDSCHSGSGTRDIEAIEDIRWQPVDPRQRPLDTYLFSPDILPRDPALKLRAGETSKRMELPEGRHVLLAACSDNETSREIRVYRQHHGAFSYFLECALLEASSWLTYRDLFERAKAGVLNHIPAQTPQLEASDDEELDRPFLGGAVRSRPAYFSLRNDTRHGWILDAGLLHHLQAPCGAETTWLAIYPYDSDLRGVVLAGALTRGKITQAFPYQCFVEVEEPGKLKIDKTYKALITRLPLPPLEVAFTGDEDGLVLARRALAHSSLDGGGSFYIREGSFAPAYRLLAKESEYCITLPADNRPVCEIIHGYTDINAGLVIHRLEHIARWRQTLDLKHPASRLAEDAIQMSVTIEDQTLSGALIPAEYVVQEGKWRPPAFTVSLQNQSDQRLYLSIVTLSESFAIGSPFFPAGGQWLEPGQSVVTPRKVSSVPDKYWKAGITERRDVLKLIVSTHAFDARLFNQPALPETIGRGDRPENGPLPGGVLNRLAYRLQTREDKDQPAEQEMEDWVTSERIMTTHRPLL